jgi:hypothetical protein
MQSDRPGDVTDAFSEIPFVAAVTTTAAPNGRHHGARFAILDRSVGTCYAQAEYRDRMQAIDKSRMSTNTLWH